MRRLSWVIWVGPEQNGFVPIEGDQRSQSEGWQREDRSRDGVMYFEDGGRGHKPRNTGYH